MINTDTTSPQAPLPVVGLLLAGGAGTRMDGKDKGMLHWRGRPMAAWVAEALRAATGSALISANRPVEEYSRLGEVFTDAPEFAGRDHPLHGVYPVAMAAALEQQLCNDNRRVMMFARSQQAQSVDCPGLSELFTNRNRPQDLKD